MSSPSPEQPKKTKPVQGIAALYQQVSAPPLDFSMNELREFNEIAPEQNKTQAEYNALVKKHGKENVIINAIKIDNNKIAKWNHFISALRPLCDFEQILWLDLSFNKLTSITPKITKFTNLRKLHLHANCITDIRDIQKLSGLKKLQDLTLHGNPIEDRGRLKYRNYIIANVPTLKSLDFTPLTSRDKASAETYCHNPSLLRTCLLDHERDRTPKQ